MARLRIYNETNKIFCQHFTEKRKEDNIKTDCKEAGYEGVDWFPPVQNSVSTVMRLQTAGGESFGQLSAWLAFRYLATCN